MDPARMDDTDFLHYILQDGEWHRQMDILSASGRVRGCGMTVHSRASSLRERGFVVVNRQHMENGRRVSEYKLLGTVRASEGPPGIGGSEVGSPMLGQPSTAVPPASTTPETAEADVAGLGHSPPSTDLGQQHQQPTLWEAA